MIRTETIRRLLLAGVVFSASWGIAEEEAWQLTGKAWEAIEKKDYDAVVRHAIEAERRWGETARQLNKGLTSYPKGDEAKRYANLNELATITMLKGDALMKKGNKEGALAAYWKLIADYKYGQCRDSKGWWWHPATPAMENIARLRKEVPLPDPAEKKAVAVKEDEQAWQVTGKAWSAMEKKDYDAVVKYADESDQTWGATARKTNRKLRAYPKGDDVKKYSNLNELATITMLKGDALRKKGDKQGAIAAYRKVLTDYKYGQCWDPQGWWWAPAGAAKDALAQLAPDSVAEITLKAEPLKASLKLPGKKGICLTLRDPKSGKKGTWEENISRLKAVKPYWNYSWGSQLAPVQPDNVEFIPMAWGAWSNEGLKKNLDTHVIPQIKAGKVKKFLGFNEPDHHDQANMSYTDALKYWPILESLNIPLCSPGCANTEGVDDDTVQGIKGTWMRDFMGEAVKRGYRVDYIAVHWYGGPGATSFKEKLVRIYEKYGKRPLLVTEFAPADWRAKTPAQNRHSKESVLAFMKDVLPWMERQNWIAGYAWFSFGQHEAVGTSSALFDKDGNLTTCGKYYASVTTENLEGDKSIKH